MYMHWDSGRLYKTNTIYTIYMKVLVSGICFSSRLKKYVQTCKITQLFMHVANEIFDNVFE